jgi:hypothetical protein
VIGAEPVCDSRSTPPPPLAELPAIVQPLTVEATSSTVSGLPSLQSSVA